MTQVSCLQVMLTSKSDVSLASRGGHLLRLLCQPLRSQFWVLRGSRRQLDNPRGLRGPLGRLRRPLSRTVPPPLSLQLVAMVLSHLASSAILIFIMKRTLNYVLPHCIHVLRNSTNPSFFSCLICGSGPRTMLTRTTGTSLIMPLPSTQFLRPFSCSG